jgi:ribonuclease Z
MNNESNATDDTPTAFQVRNPYAGHPGSGITLPPYYRPTPYLKNVNNYFPGLETVGPDEMRISFVGSCPFPPRRDQAGTCIMVELGNGNRFFFDFGPGCMRNIVAMQVPFMAINDIFISHLHVDHYADLLYVYAFAAPGARFKPLRVTGPSGRTEKYGTRAMIAAMQQMAAWHTDSFAILPVGDGYEVEVNEFDWKDDNGLCYDKHGVQIRHWRRSHAMDGASAYRLDWNGLSFVWTSDGRPDELTMQYAKGVDVFVTELQLDAPRLLTLKLGLAPDLSNYGIDTFHTPHYAAGYLIKQVDPRLGMVTHLEYDEDQKRTRNLKVDPAKYYPPDVARELVTQWPKGLSLKLTPPGGQLHDPRGSGRRGDGGDGASRTARIHPARGQRSG